MSVYHLILFSGGQPVQHGWWPEEATSRRKFRDWIGSGVADARVTLTEEIGAFERLLDSWPDGPEGQSAG